jgi:hypothetical protein
MGPEFDASLVNFDVLMQRNAMYRGQECQSLKLFDQNTRQNTWPAPCRARHQGKGESSVAFAS